MLPTLDIYPIARHIIEDHGTRAAATVEEYFESCLSNGDTEGQLIWREVLKILRAMDHPAALR